MNIDFITRYDQEYFKLLCVKARRFDYHGLVVTGLEKQKTQKFGDLFIFPGEEVYWEATFCRENLERYTGIALVIMPEGKTLKKYQDKSLSTLLENVTSEGGITVSLHDDSNNVVPLYLDPNKSFDALMIKPYDEFDIKRLIPTAKVSVAGSYASKPDELTFNKAFTLYFENITDKSGLIELIKTAKKNSLIVNTIGGPIGIEETI